ncbi:efflux RND transporter periplasmic adaptor subunit [Rhizobacter sp. SG703]|uniref:efflux RND transporter periplasmic adaptor subunit n=1 Tax=Rhizobacter sp. SG703 TaxID=2587140 RepID=UPI001446BE8F|nr:efflux RND transporter periplasmic adaptor subunit [Rhizobacter sp. SG703]NKI93644.1 RND family efflux transporter MFP subunit [Rhizobacter sp. SG703]
MNKSLVGWVVAAVVVVAGVGYGLASRGKGEGPGGAAAPSAAASGAPVSVSTVRAQRRDYEVTLEATGSVTALNSVDIRPQVASTITQVHIKEGQFVKAGELLFTLDARTDEVNVAKAQAQLEKDLASLADAQRQLTRSKDLLAQNFVSQSAVDSSQTLVEGQQAVVSSDRAALAAAKVALGYNRIVAPGAGRAGAINVFPGSSVQPATSTLVTLTQIDPIAVGFNLPQRNLGEALRNLQSGRGVVTAVLPEGRGTLTGKLQFVDNNIDASSGTVKVKAVFDNKQQTLWPGAFVSVRLVVETLKDATVVPQASLIQGPRGNIVYVVDDGNKAVARPIVVVQAAGTEAVVTGVKPGERVVVDGRQNLRPGAPVAERAASGAAGKGAAAGASATSATSPTSGVTP